MHKRTTQSDIAKGLGVSLRRVAQLKIDGMPVDSTEAAKAWRLSEKDKASGDGTTEELRREKIALTRSQRQKIELQISIEKGRYLLRSTADDEGARIAEIVKSLVKKFENDLPPLIFGKRSLGEVREITRLEARKIQLAVADELHRFFAEHPQEP